VRLVWLVDPEERTVRGYSGSGGQEHARCFPNPERGRYSAWICPAARRAVHAYSISRGKASGRNKDPLSPCTRGRGVGGEGRRSSTALSSTGLAPPPHPQPLSPEYRERGEKKTRRSPKKAFARPCFKSTVHILYISRDKLFPRRILIFHPLGLDSPLSRSYPALCNKCFIGGEMDAQQAARNPGGDSHLDGTYVPAPTAYRPGRSGGGDVGRNWRDHFCRFSIPPIPGRFGTVWGCVFAGATLATCLGTVRRGLECGERIWSRQARAVLLALLPSFFAACVLTAFFFARAEQPVASRGVDALLRQGALATATYAPSFIRWLGVLFLLFGAVTFGSRAELGCLHDGPGVRFWARRPGSGAAPG